jgi:DNA-binding NtrC family response regulator
LQNTLVRAALWSNGNILEKQDIQDALLPISCTKDTIDVVGRPLGEGLKLEEIMSDVARHYLERAMKETAGNKSKATKLLGLNNYQTMDNWLRKYGVDK